MAPDPYDAVQDARSDRSDWNEADVQDDAAEAFRWGYVHALGAILAVVRDE